MAAEDGTALLDWKTKYENSEQSLQTLKKLSHTAVADYEDLQRRYDQNQKAYDELKTRLQDTEYQLHSLQRALEPACEEYKQLQDMYTIEQSCRTEAEKYASNVHKQNKKLKRQSQMLLETVQAQNIPIEKLGEMSIAEADIVEEDSRAEEMVAKIDKLESHIDALKERIGGVEAERDGAIQSELMLKRELEQYQEALNNAHETISQHESMIQHYAKVSEQACQEHESLKEKYEQEQELRMAAEKFASNMSSQREAMARESSVLLATAASDMRLTEAFMQIEDLQKELQLSKDASQRKVRELEDVIENDVSSKKIEDLEMRLEVSTEEISQQQKQIKELQKWKEKLEKDYKDLEQELDITKQRLPVIPPAPPPPPPPPASLFKIFRPNKKKADATNKTAEPKGKQANSNAEFNKALDEMMARIKSGKPLRPAAERRPSLPELQTQGKASAMAELNDMLKKIKKPSTDDSHIGMSSTRTTSNTANSDFFNTFNKIRGGGGTTTVSPNLSRISEESESRHQS